MAWQYGGGLFVEGNSNATLTDINVYENRARVGSPVEPCLSSHPAPLWNVTCAHGWQSGGGGLYIHLGGTATLTNTNVYENQAADYVCSPVEPCLSSHPAPRWNIMCARGWQDGGGLYIWGTATLTGTNVYGNQAGSVCSRVEPSLSSRPALFLMECRVCSWLAEWRGTLHQGHGNADQHQRVRESGKCVLDC